MKEIPKAYNPKKVEDKIYKAWEKSGFFNPDNLPGENIKKDENGEELTYTIVLPPPNITSKLHLGHAAMLAIEDLLIRYHRMKGYRTLWIPGTDHAAIATQNVVEKKLLKEEGLTRHDLGREEFLKKVWEYLEKTQAVILNQTKRMGASLNWSREAFTLDKQREKAVRKMFVEMYKAGVIYRGERIVNWCPRCHSTLADDEVEYKKQKAMLYTFRYSKDFPFTIATTRPETKLGDTAVAVNPKDERYKKYIGKIYEVDFCGVKLKLKIIADRHVEMDFGTGALGVTPAHSMADWQMAEKNNLEIIKVIGEDGKIRDGFGEYSNRSVQEVREMIVKKLKKNGLLEKKEEIENNLSLCYRCGTAIEPLPSEQWFIKVNEPLERLGGKSLKEKAIETAENKSIKFIPERFEKRYLDWMENLHDWCISRQIWFGHRIPVWRETYVGTEYEAIHFNKNVLLKKLGLKNEAEFNNFSDNILLDEGCDISWAGENPLQLDQKYIRILKDKGLINDTWIEENKIKRQTTESEVYCDMEPPKGIGWIQDEDSLDTWFSSGMWTFSTLGWPDNFKDGKKTGDLAKFYPTQVLETGYEILTLWVSRMIMMSLFALQEIPFKNVYLHGMVLDKHGKKMSKSKGNGIDPIEMIEKYGTDAVRLSLLIGSTPGNDVRFSEEKIEGQRNFVNKLWNISRYILMSVDDVNVNTKSLKPKTLADKWILEELDNLIHMVNNAIENYQFSSAFEIDRGIRDFMWNKLADWYLEISKIQNKNDPILIYVLETLLKLCHPFIPFVTEQIWSEMGKEKMLMIEEWAENKKGGLELTQTNVDFNMLQGIIQGIRIKKNEYKIPLKKKVEVIINAKERKDLTKDEIESIKRNKDIIEALAGTRDLKIKRGIQKIEGWTQFDSRVSVYINLENLIDKEKEKKSLEKEINNLKKYLDQIKNKLDNKKFIANAPDEIVKKEKNRYNESIEKLRKLEKN